MSPEQCREAREKLNWTQEELAKTADVPLWYVCAFEDGDAPEFLEHLKFALWEAFEEAGIGFPFEIEHGRARPAGITYSPRDKGKTH
jgi:predicted transcriptional regulator